PLTRLDPTMAEAELKIRHVTYPIAGKWDALWYNFIEGIGRAAGWAVVIGIAALFISSHSDDATNEDPAEISSQ
ncbi:MAG: hypothetical protein ACPG4X_21205, partial [Pikeienuella sp.]